MKAVLLIFILLTSNAFSETKLSDSEMVTELKRHLREFEKQFHELNIDEVLKKGSVKELDNIKDDFYEYKNFLSALKLYGSNEKSEFISQNDEFKTFLGIGIPMKTESFSSRDVRERLEMAKYKWEEYTPQNVVYLKFKRLAHGVVPALNAKEKIARMEKEKVEENKRELTRLAHIKQQEEQKERYSSPACQKAIAFANFCNEKLNISIFSSSIEYENMISARSGTKSHKIRGFTKLLVFSEEKLAEAKKQYSSINSTGPSLNECVIDPGTGTTQSSISSKTNLLLTKLLKEACDLDDWRMR